MTFECILVYKCGAEETMFTANWMQSIYKLPPREKLKFEPEYTDCTPENIINKGGYTTMELPQRRICFDYKECKIINGKRKSYYYEL